MKTIVCLILVFINFFAFSQEKKEKKHLLKGKVYELNPKLDWSIGIGGLITNYIGLRVLKNKKLLDTATVLSLDINKINAFDRGAAKQDMSRKAEFISYSNYSLTVCYLAPLLLMLDKDIRKDATQILVLYLETGSIMGNIYSWGVGYTTRIRPWVYNENTAFGTKFFIGTTNSFYSGHVAAGVSTTFFAVRVFSDYHPHSRLTPWLYGAALLPPAGVGYFRYRAGMHFPTDILAGVPVGIGVALLNLQIHKKKEAKNISLLPISGEINGIALNWKF